MIQTCLCLLHALGLIIHNANPDNESSEVSSSLHASYFSEILRGVIRNGSVVHTEHWIVVCRNVSLHCINFGLTSDSSCPSSGQTKEKRGMW